MQLSGTWVVFAGDSTHRQLYHSFGSALQAEAGIMLRYLGPPTLNGAAVVDHDLQKDQDMVGWKKGARRKGARDGTIVSLRFLRGLDLAKLELHTRDWRQRYFYPDMAVSNEAIRRLKPLNLRSVLQSDAPDARNFAAHDAGPDVVVLHACAWDLPLINRSKRHFPFMEPRRTCPPTPEQTNVLIERARLASSNDSDVRAARVAAAPCLSRGDTLSDDIIFEGFTERLHAAIVMLRTRFTGRLLLRNCHAGTDVTTNADGNVSRHIPAFMLRDEAMKREQLMRMNALLSAAAQRERVELVDVFAIDESLGVHRGIGKDRFHVPDHASFAAALALEWQLLGRTGQPPRTLADAKTWANRSTQSMAFAASGTADTHRP